MILLVVLYIVVVEWGQPKMFYKRAYYPVSDEERKAMSEIQRSFEQRRLAVKEYERELKFRLTPTLI